MDSTHPSVDLDALYDDCAQRVAGIAYLVTGDEVVAARVVAEAFGNAHADPGALAHWPSTGESWARAEVIRIVERPRIRLRPQSLPVPADPRDVPVMFALADLPLRHRAALALHHVAGLDAVGVALETEATVGASAARIANAEEFLSGPAGPFGEDLPERLRGAAERAAVPLPGLEAARALPGRRASQSLALAGVGLLALVCGPAAAQALGPQVSADVVLAGADVSGDALGLGALDPAAQRRQEQRAERERQEERLRAFEARGALVLGPDELGGASARDAVWTPMQGPADFLQHKKKAPKVNRPERAVKAKAVIERAFVHDDHVFVTVARTGSKFDAKPRTYRVEKAAQVKAGRELTAALAGPSTAAPSAATGPAEASSLPIAQYLWLVEHSDARTTPVVLEFDSRGRVTGIAEAKKR